jgi:hypothetical protein
MPLSNHRRFVSNHGFPVSSREQSLHDEQDLQRAIEAYRFFYPTISAESIFRGNRELGIDDGAGIAILNARPRHIVLTANSDTPYGCGVVDLRASGPLVVDMPSGPYVALINDHHQRWVADLGLPGPDAGQGGKYLVLPPDFLGEVPVGYHVRHSQTYMILIALRALPLEHDQQLAFESLRQVKVYPLARPDDVLPFIDITDRGLDTTPMRCETNLEYWRQLHGVLRSEPVIDEFRPMHGVLAALGIAIDKEFAPDRRMQQILERAAQAGLEQMRAEAFASQRGNTRVWEDRRWEWVGLGSDPNFETKDYLDVQARDRWFYQAILTSPAMFRRTAGSGSVYFLAARDQEGTYLDGSNTYKLRVPQPVPATLFWSVTLYDARTRSQVMTPQNKASLGSLDTHFMPESDGTVEIYFGPRAPHGREKQWIQTTPGCGFFMYFRIYGPAAEALNGEWRLEDVSVVESQTNHELESNGHSAALLRSIMTPDSVKTRIGMLRFNHGVPTDDAAALVYDNLDRMHAVEAFLNSYQAVSMGAIRSAMLDAGVRDNDALLFSNLMDSRTLVLTANCDTVYFMSFLDLSDGPIVVDIPPRVLGAVDDMWFKWVTDIGTSGPDRGAGGKYLFKPRSYDGPLPEGGFFVCESATDRVFLFGRAFLENDSPAPAVERIRGGLRIHPYLAGGYGSSIAAYLEQRAPLAALTVTRETRFIEGSGLEINTIPPSDISYFKLLDTVVQQEPADALNPELAGQFAAVGIQKGRPFQPDSRMRRILEEAVALGNATARTIAMHPSSAEGFQFYGTRSAWLNPLLTTGFDFVRPSPSISTHGVELSASSGALNLNARTSFFYFAIGVSPAMCMQLAGSGSQYLVAMMDATGSPLVGSRAYKVRLPPSVPAGVG